MKFKIASLVSTNHVLYLFDDFVRYRTNGLRTLLTNVELLGDTAPPLPKGTRGIVMDYLSPNNSTLVTFLVGTTVYGVHKDSLTTVSS